MSRQYPSASLETKTFGQKRGPDGDRTYNCMPLYHGTGGLAAMNDLMSGISHAIGKKFSLSNFWQDCIDSNSTIFIYVGETARYLLSLPPSPNDRKHKIRLMWGNGLQLDVWEKFQERFGIPEVGEFFAMTEGMLTTINHYRSGLGFGAVGHHGWLLRRRFRDTYIPVEVDTDSGDIWREPKTGFAKRNNYEDGGEILVKMSSEGSWTGYWHAERETNKRLVRDVFRKGDLYYRTGDALRRDADGFWYFMDRLGDTYRWKGENVSTTEVSQVFGTFPGILEANIYGVALPFHDGKAGCAAVVLENGLRHSFPWQELLRYLQSKLPRYAIPLFIRMVHVEIGGMSTENNKQNKVALRHEGVDPDLYGTKVSSGDLDKIFWVPPGGDSYVPFGKAEWHKLQSREVKL